MQAALTTTRAANYTVQEMQSPAGVTVREYVSPAGKVFAIAWNGPFPPDLKQLLGTYSAPFQQAVQNQPPGHHPVSIRQSNLVVQLSGHMGSFSGRAYLADQLPAGVGAEAIR